MKQIETDEIIFLKKRWQKEINKLADSLNIPCAAITRLQRPKIENFIISESDENPATAGHVGRLTGSYCERVIDTQQELIIPNALIDTEWDHNPDIKINLISYLGLPLVYPDGQPFGTICILDKKENKFSREIKEKLEDLKDKFEADLNHLIK
jgi:c-di-GMP phosphodiesterase